MVNESFAYSVSDAIGLCGLMIFFFQNDLWRTEKNKGKGNLPERQSLIL